MIRREDCNCLCHRQPGVVHVVACCDGGDPLWSDIQRQMDEATRLTGPHFTTYVKRIEDLLAMCERREGVRFASDREIRKALKTAFQPEPKAKP